MNPFQPLGPSTNGLGTNSSSLALPSNQPVAPTSTSNDAFSKYANMNPFKQPLPPSTNGSGTGSNAPNATPSQSTIPSNTSGLFPAGFPGQTGNNARPFPPGFTRITAASTVANPSPLGTNPPINGQIAAPVLQNQNQAGSSTAFVNPFDKFRSGLSSNATTSKFSNPILQKYAANTSIQTPTNVSSNIGGVSSVVQPSYGQGTQSSLGPPVYNPTAAFPTFMSNPGPQNYGIAPSSNYTLPSTPMQQQLQQGPSFALSSWWTQPVTPALFENYTDTRPVLPMAPPPPPRRPFVIEPLPSQKEWWDAKNKAHSTQRLYVWELETSTRGPQKMRLESSTRGLRERRRYMGDEGDFLERSVRLFSMLSSHSYI